MQSRSYRFKYGKWQGLSHQEVKAKYEELYVEWIKNSHQVKMSAGECLNDVSERAMGVAGDVIAQYKG